MFTLTRQIRPVAAAIRGSPAPLLARAYHAKDIPLLQWYYSRLHCFVFELLILTLILLLDHYKNPRNVGSMNKNDMDVGTGLVGAPACGDVMKLQIRVDDNGVISDVKFKTFGCGSAIASSSYLTELVRGMTLDEAGKVKNTAIAKELSLPPVKLHCSMLAEDAIKSAIKDYQSKRASRTVLSDSSVSSLGTKQASA
ncbi:NifU-like N terminal domain-containing protein [Lipomyces oligophaga]|uniref:NifU-like N terminal domain-containing protein n=1 Tax=Lipomyces oligophaga TaxID=45792 RepID=UPI0034CEBA94